jgi:hypothetical protein
LIAATNGEYNQRSASKRNKGCTEEDAEEDVDETGETLATVAVPSMRRIACLHWQRCEVLEKGRINWCLFQPVHIPCNLPVRVMTTEAKQQRQVEHNVEEEAIGPI